MTSRRHAEKAGRRAEALAALWLRLKGYRIVGHRVHTPYGELDLIASRRKTLAFVEVKNRAHYDEAITSLGRRQKGRLVRAASAWRGLHETAFSSLQPRFDLIVITQNLWPHHLEGVFGAEGENLKNLI